MKTKFLNEEITYDGKQLTSHWIFKKTGWVEDGFVSFVGPCNVTLEHMVDLVDVKEEKPIYSQSMLHFIGEFFDTPLEIAILRQRMLITLAQQELALRGHKIIRGGNDLFDQTDGAKLSVAIATCSPVSSLFHFGINILSEGTPVKTRGLKDYEIEVKSLAEALLASFADELASVQVAKAKVRPVA